MHSRHADTSVGPFNVWPFTLTKACSRCLGQPSWCWYTYRPIHIKSIYRCIVNSSYSSQYSLSVSDAFLSHSSNNYCARACSLHFIIIYYILNYIYKFINNYYKNINFIKTWYIYFMSYSNIIEGFNLIYILIIFYKDYC